MPTPTPHDLLLAAKAKRHGARWALTTIAACKANGLPIAAGFAMLTKESGFRNVFGHDPTNSIPTSWRGTRVTKDKYKHYKRNRKAGKGMQGVGPTQLTWWEFQDNADRDGGCYRPRANIREGIRILGSHYKKYKARGESKRDALRHAFRDYNGSGPAAEEYGRDGVKKYDQWLNRLF